MPTPTRSLNDQVAEVKRWLNLVESAQTALSVRVARLHSELQVLLEDHGQSGGLTLEQVQTHGGGTNKEV